MNTMRRLILFVLTSCVLCGNSAAQDTQRLYLSGTGCDDMKEWDFRCSDGRNSGQWTKIGVPSCWELQGFGTYQYGMRFYGKASPEGIADEKGFYKTEFTLPREWEGRQIELVFEAVFTDARVTINGRKAGQGLYQGGFTRHTIDISDRVFFGPKKNRLEVEVAKESANAQVNLAERRADYWNFGGIWRPVFIVAKPWQNIRRVAIDAKADGRFQADVFLSRALPGSSVSIDIVGQASQRANANAATLGSVAHYECAIASDHAHLDFTVKNPKPWNAEQPNLYTAVFTLRDAGGNALHVERQRFGFRTIEYGASPNLSKGGENRGAVSLPLEGSGEPGVFINGQKVIFKGVNRHSFRPETGRTLSKAKNIEDVKLIKSMNMNAVRLSHYPADPEFLDACDSLGLYVECELPGWHHAHETIVGSQIAEEMVTRDVNHPCIIFWSNGNEGGFNYELEPVFHKFDPQQRVVLYPWANRNGFETKHYRSWGETAEYMRQKEIFMPTEFLHGLYDGGHGAGLKDYWELMMSNPRCAGGFLWDLQDQAVLRTDLSDNRGLTSNDRRQTTDHRLQTSDDRLQVFDPVGNFGSDGIVGPHGEREGSYYTIKEVWSPIQLSISNDTIFLKNLYDFTNLKDCRFTYRHIDMPAFGEKKVTVVSEGILKSPDVKPGETAIVGEASKLCNSVLQITATDPHGEEIFTWSTSLNNMYSSGLQSSEASPTTTSLKVQSSEASPTTASLKVQHSEALSTIIASETDSEFIVTVNKSQPSNLKSQSSTPKSQSSNLKSQIIYTFSKKDGHLQSVAVAPANSQLLTPNSQLLTLSGPRFIAAKRSDRSDDGFYNHDDKEAFQKKTQYTEYKDQGVFSGFDFKDGTLKATYRHGSLTTVEWQFNDDGTVHLTAYTTFNGVVDMMGICFDYPEDKVTRKHWVGRGPYRVWQNRMEGPQYGYWQTDYNDPIPGESWEYPEFKGYFADVKWMQIETTEGKIGIEPTLPRSGDACYIGVFTPRDGRDHILYDLPETGLALLEVIPAVRNKVNTTDLNGPSAQPHFVSGQHTYSATLRFE